MQMPRIDPTQRSSQNWEQMDPSRQVNQECAMESTDIQHKGGVTGGVDVRGCTLQLRYGIAPTVCVFAVRVFDFAGWGSGLELYTASTLWYYAYSSKRTGRIIRQSTNWY